MKILSATPLQTPTPSAHASTIAETAQGLIAAWFGGSDEGHPDISIYVALQREGRWQPGTQVADGAQADGRRYPCWNPVLYAAPSGRLHLFYKVGPSPRAWWGMQMSSLDCGQTWSTPRRLPQGIYGPIKNKPIALGDGRLLCGSSVEDDGWRVHMEWTSDEGLTWARSNPLNERETFAAIQPTLLDYGASRGHKLGRIQALCRTRQGCVAELWSEDGQRWIDMRCTSLANPNSGFDGVVLRDGRAALVYNPDSTEGDRHRLWVALSVDQGQSWTTALALEEGPGEYSYPAVIEGQDGRVHITYTWRRRHIQHVTCIF